MYFRRDGTAFDRNKYIEVRFGFVPAAQDRDGNAVIGNTGTDTNRIVYYPVLIEKCCISGFIIETDIVQRMTIALIM